jgi:hypothetical protein
VTPRGTFNVTNEDEDTFFSDLDGTGYFCNKGSFVVTIPAGKTFITYVLFENHGNLNIYTGTMDMGPGGNHTGSFVATTIDAILRFSTGVHVLLSDSSVLQASGVIHFNGAQTTIYGFFASSFIHNSGTTRFGTIVIVMSVPYVRMNGGELIFLDGIGQFEATDLILNAGTTRYFGDITVSKVDVSGTAILEFFGHYTNCDSITASGTSVVSFLGDRGSINILVILDTATVDLHGLVSISDATLDGTSTLYISGDENSDSEVNITKSLDWVGQNCKISNNLGISRYGRLNFLEDSKVNIRGSGNMQFLWYIVVHNYGETIYYPTVGIHLRDGAKWINELGSIFNATYQNGDSRLNEYPSLVSSYFVNIGTVVIHLQTTIKRTFFMIPYFSNNGQLSVESGIFDMGPGGEHEGSFRTDAGAEIVFTQGTHTLLESSNVMDNTDIIFNGANTIVYGIFTSSFQQKSGKTCFRGSSTTTEVFLTHMYFILIHIFVVHHTQCDSQWW